MIKSSSANLRAHKQALVTFADINKLPTNTEDDSRPSRKFSVMNRVKTEETNRLILNRLSSSPDLDDKAKMQIIMEKMDVVKSQLLKGKKSLNLFDKPKLSAVITKIDQRASLTDAFQSRSETPMSIQQKEKTSFKFVESKKRAQSDYEDVLDRLRQLSQKKQQILNDMKEPIRRSQPAIDEFILTKSEKRPLQDQINRTLQTKNFVPDQTNLKKTSYSKSILGQLKNKVNRKPKENQPQRKGSQEVIKPKFQGVFEGFGRMTNSSYKVMKTNLLDILGDVCISQEQINWSTYEGQVKDNQFHGHGVLMIGDKYRIQGEFCKGKAQGKISIICLNRLSEGIVGDFKNGLLDKVHTKVSIPKE